MITSIYEGGLGNLLFQVAAGVSFAIDNNDIYRINPANHIGLGQGNTIINYLDNIFSKIEKTDFTSSNIYHHHTNKYIDIPYLDGLCLRGYFQNFSYLKNHKNLIREIFNLNYLNFNKIKEKKILTIHVRGGDYKQYPNFNIITKKYYENCLNKIDVDEYEIYIVSDCLSTVKEKIPDIQYKFFNGTEIQDLFLLSKSDTCIISNSTFAWWGSFLGDEKIVYAPSTWCADTDEFLNIYSDNMIKINY
jgi:hypothetical protein